MFYENFFGLRNFDDGHWRFQLRDRFGRWIKMGGLCKFEFSKPGDKTRYSAYGTFQGNKRQGWSTIRVGEGEALPPGDYEVDSRFITSVKAVIRKNVAAPKVEPKKIDEKVEKTAASRDMIAATVGDLTVGDIVQQNTPEALYGEITSVEHGDKESKINVKWSDGSSYDMNLPKDQKIKLWDNQESDDSDASDEEWLQQAIKEYDANRDLMNGDSSEKTTFVPDGSNIFDGFDGVISKFVPDDPNNPTGPGKVERTKASGLKYINNNGRITTLVNINGTMVPFYLSSGSGGKKDVEAGKWYPFFGASEADDWYNKSNAKYINNYYGSPELRAQAEWLDANVGDIRDDKSIPVVGADQRDAFRDLINQDMHPVDNLKDGEPGAENVDALMKANVADVLKRVRQRPKSKFTPPTDPAEIEALRVKAEEQKARIAESEPQRKAEAEARAKLKAEQEAKAAESYKMAHRPPSREDTAEEGVAASLDKIDQVFPPDILDPAKQNIYRTGDVKADKETFDVINSIKGNPDAEVTIYRAVPGDVEDAFKAGDWVTLSPTYAQGHVDSNVPGGKVVSKKVKASELFTNADSIHEWGYDPEPENVAAGKVNENLGSGRIEDLGIDFQPATMDAGGTRLPTPGAFTGEFQNILRGAKDWKEVQERLKGQTITYFDFETTGISDYDGDEIKNDPVQLGAVQVKDGKIINRFNVYMDPRSKLSEWSANNLKRDIVDENGEITGTTLVTPDWLETQMSQKEALEQFIDFIGPKALLGGQNVPFDLEILKRMSEKFGIELDIAGTIDSKDLASLLPKYDPEKGIDGPKAPDRKTGEIRASSSLGPVANFLGFEPANWHSADGDAEDSYNLVSRIIDRAANEGNVNYSLLDFPEQEKQYQEKMAAFKEAISPASPVTERQLQALVEFSKSKRKSIAYLAQEALDNLENRDREDASFVLSLINRRLEKLEEEERNNPKQDKSINNRNAHEEFWGDYDPERLKAEVAEDIARRMIFDKGITPEEMYAAAFSPQFVNKYNAMMEQDESWWGGGSMQAGDVYVTVINKDGSETEIITLSDATSIFGSGYIDDNQRIKYEDLEEAVQKINDILSGVNSKVYIPSTLNQDRLNEAASSMLIKRWAVTSNDSDIKALAVQEVAKEVFNITEDIPWEKADFFGNMLHEHVKEHNKTYKALLEAQYEATQEKFAELGIKEVTLFRGIKTEAYLGSEGIEGVEYVQRPLSAWSSDPRMADTFSLGRGIIFRKVVPVDQILSTSFTGFGCYTEWEFVLIGGSGEAQAINSRDQMTDRTAKILAKDWF